jgi:hypothetical protein
LYRKRNVDPYIVRKLDRERRDGLQFFHMQI